MTTRRTSPPAGVPWFSAVPHLTTPIPDGPEIDVQSAAIATALTTGDHVMSVVEYAFGLYRATARTRRYSRRQVASWAVDVPMDATWTPPPGSDGSVVVVDPVRRRHWCLWQYDPETLSFSGGGWADPAGTLPTVKGGTASGANFAWSAGIIRIQELVDGHIPHALVFSTDIARVGDLNFRFPATRNDGLNLRGGGTTVMEGSRIQLDPAVDLSTIPAGYQRTIAAALQTYGAYVVDNGSSTVNLGCELVSGYSEGAGGGWWEFTHAGLASVGITGDYPDLDDIPWDDVRVLAAWDGS